MKEIDYIEKTLFEIKKYGFPGYENTFDNLKIKSPQKGPIVRLFHSYTNTGVADFLSNLRHVCTIFRQPIRVPDDAFSWAKHYEEDFGLSVDIENQTVSAKPNVLTDIEDLKYSYSLIKRRNNANSFPDPDLFNYFGFTSYISLSQKMMIQTMKNMELGSTLLACLPTGNGKSLLWQYGVACGKFSHTTIVIVPTNALATDHAKSDQKRFERLPWIESINYEAADYNNDLAKMDYLCSKIKDSSRFILYISPEGLTNSGIKKAIIDSARRGNMSSIVIDEAHLVIDWGMKFRPEFQFLPALIKQIKDYSNNSIYTVLLSATITEHDKYILYQIFGDDKFIEYRGDELRPEIEYFKHHCYSENERQELLERLIRVVPKPAIVYVGTIAQSEKYEQLIRNIGFKRIERFNGQTVDREKIITKWRNDEIDIIVATSAFGMGVDKADVRTIITAYTPENISRYYQEVGRSGRDGYSSLNFVLYCPREDKGVVASSTDKKVISTSNLWSRWQALQLNSEKAEGNCITLDTDAKHGDLTYEITGTQNSGWNDNVISMLARAGFISILDVNRKKTNDNHKAYKIKVRIDDINICFEEQEYIEKIDKFRELERQEIVDGRDTVCQLLEDDDGGCYATAFVNEFIYSSMLCSGCPYCRKNGVKPYFTKSRTYIFSQNRIIDKKKNYLFRNIASVCTNHKTYGMIEYDENTTDDDIEKLIIKMICAETNIIVLDKKERLNIKNISSYSSKELLIIEAQELADIQDTFISGSILYILTEDDVNNSLMIKAAKKYKKRELDLNQIFLAPTDYFDEEESRYLVDCVEYVKNINVLLGEEIIC